MEPDKELLARPRRFFEILFSKIKADEARENYFYFVIKCFIWGIKNIKCIFIQE